MSTKKIIGIFAITLIINLFQANGQELKIDPLQRIQYLIQMGNFEKAIEFSEALDDSLFCAKKELLGFSYRNLGKHDLAIENYKEYINQCNPSYIQRINLGDSYFQIDSLELAEKQFKKVIESNPEFSLAYYNLGQIEYKRNNKNDAAKYFIDAINNSGKTLDFDSVEMAIQSLIDIKKYENALMIADQVISMWDENSSEAKYSQILKAMIYGEMGNYEKAISDIDKVIESNIEHPAVLLEAHSNKLIYYDKLNQIEKACIEFSEIKKIDPNAPILKNFNCD